jgi:hypothetical protein
MVLCLLALFQGAIKLLPLLQQVTKNSCILAQEMSIIPHVKHMALDSCHVPFFPSRKVLYFARFLFHWSLILSSLQASESEWKTVTFQQFCRQLYHSCLTYVYSPLRSVMTIPEVVRCPDGHFRRYIFSIGPYIVDYPEQVWLSCVVRNWCPK